MGFLLANTTDITDTFEDQLIIHHKKGHSGEIHNILE